MAKRRWLPKTDSEHPQVWMVLCRGESDGARSSYPLNEKHALIVLVAVAEEELHSAVESLLGENGWLRPTIQCIKQLHEPFSSDDADITQCYVAARDGLGGVIVYADPVKIEETH